jgi:hypothetical protein
MRRALAKSLGAAEERFIISVKTDNSGTSNNDQFKLAWYGTYDVDWGDGNKEIGLVNNQTHTYASPGIYDVKVTATTGQVRFRSNGDEKKLLEIKNWGTCQWTSVQAAYYGCDSLTQISAEDIPDLSIANIDYSQMFYGARRIENWGTISQWDFSGGVSFSQFMFYLSRYAANPITNLNITNWDMSSASNIGALFWQGLFNSTKTDIGNPNNWNTSNLSNIGNMFYQSNIEMSAFNLSSWDISNITIMNDFMKFATGMSTTNYNETLISWAAQTPQSNINVNFGNSQYTLGGAAEAARNTLINTYGWTITDGGGV